jgi:hypothetical protein
VTIHPVGPRRHNRKGTPVPKRATPIIFAVAAVLMLAACGAKSCPVGHTCLIPPTQVEAKP